MKFPLLLFLSSLFSLCAARVAKECVYLPKDDQLQLEIDPDIFRNVSELISSKGYPVEEYDVQTADGYILGVQRISHGKTQNVQDQKPKKAVYVQHGLLADSSCFILNSAEKSLATILADAGYDVWLGNSRGNTYSRRHVKYTPRDKEFWHFTFDEMAQYDLPAIIDFIINKTGNKEIYYIGHSQGTAVMFALLSENPEYNHKLKLGIAMAPIATVGYMTSPIRYLAPLANELDLLRRVLGLNEFLPDKSLVHYISELVCDEVIRRFCENELFLESGIDPDQFNVTRSPVYLSHTPSGTSTYNIIHFAQLVNSMNFQKMDYGKEENMRRYGQETPPLYHVENITAPVALMWSLNDWMADPADVTLLAQKLKSVVVNYQVPYPKWAHLDYAIGIDADKYVYPEILKMLSKF